MADLDIAIDKAIANGFDEEKYRELLENAPYYPFELIFNHDFARALWPSTYPSNHYAYHLMAAALSDDPVAYVRANS